MTRREQLIVLLRWLDEAVDGGGGGLAGWVSDGLGSRLLTFGPLWAADLVGSFARLLVALERLQVEHPLERRHLLCRYSGGWTVRRTLTWSGGCYRGLAANEEVVAGSSSLTGRLVSTGRTAAAREEEVTVHVWPGWVDLLLVERGLDELERCYPGEPTVPRVLVA